MTAVGECGVGKLKFVKVEMCPCAESEPLVFSVQHLLTPSQPEELMCEDCQAVEVLVKEQMGY